MESNGTFPENALSGKRIVITRSPGQGEDLRAELSRNAGAHVIELPCVEFRELEETSELDRVIGRLGEFAWLLFTSQNAAKFFARRARALGFDFARLPEPRPRVAAIGPATAEAAKSEDSRWILFQTPERAEVLRGILPTACAASREWK